MTMQTPTDKAKTWRPRIADARTRRERYTQLWAYYARMHTNAYKAMREKNDDSLIELPNGDQIKVGLVFRNIEQTRALLEIPEIGVRATATDYTRELGSEDTHREAVVEQAIYRSLLTSGLVKGSEESDYIKLDGTIIGHGINYTGWRVLEEEVDMPPIPLLAEAATGEIAPIMKGGVATFEPVRANQVVWEGCQDESISPLQFLADASCKRFEKAGWQGFERPTKLEELKLDKRYNIPDDIVGGTFSLKDVYGVESQAGEEMTDAVMVVVIWDKIGRELLTFIEINPQTALGASASSSGAGRRKPGKQGENLIVISEEKWPLRFSHPDDSPFTFYVPIPARDHPFGISQIEHVRNQATEADKLRTRQANITRQIKRIPWYNKARVDSDQLRAALKSDDMEPVGLDIRENEKPEQIFGELPVPTVHPDIYRQYIIAEQGVDKTTGVSDVPGGGADTATEAEFVFQIGGARTSRKKRLYLKLLTGVARCHRDYLRAFGAEGDIIVVPDVDGRPMTLAYGRQAFDGEFDIEVIPGGGAMSVSPVKQKMLLEFGAQTSGKYGPLFERAWLRQMLTQFDVRGVNELMRAAMMGMQQLPAPPDGQQADFSPANYTGPQTLRAGINAPNEG